MSIFIEILLKSLCKFPSTAISLDFPQGVILGDGVGIVYWERLALVVGACGLALVVLRRVTSRKSSRYVYT